MRGCSKKIILGSNSPRRKELLAGLDIEFTVDTGNTFQESMDPSVPAEQEPLLMARGKSHGFYRPLQDDELLITADTVVVAVEPSSQKTVALGKPRDRQDALSMLRMLSGRVHKVITAVTLRDSDTEKSFAVTTDVSFRELSDTEIEYYVDNYKPYDKAGSYGIQEWIGFIGIDRIEGSYFNVMGFPVCRVYEEICKFVRFTD